MTADAFGEQVELTLRRFVAARRAAVAHPRAVDLVDLVSGLLFSGGKRVRPALCHLGWRGAGGTTGPEIVAVACAFELLHTFALIHDDIMDGGETRRSVRCVHRDAAGTHTENHWHGSSADFGVATAILAGDMAFAWADQLFAECGLPAERVLAAHRVFSVMRNELVVGQYLDLLNSVTRHETARPETINRLKSSLYTVVRPLQVGGTLAGGSDELLLGYAAFGEPLGDAYQLRDDVLGLFGDPQRTGKAITDDLRTGKRTLLVTLALTRATGAQRVWLAGILGDQSVTETQARRAGDIVRACGALAEVEEAIAKLAARADAELTALAIDEGTRGDLRAMAGRLVDRDR